MPLVRLSEDEEPTPNLAPMIDVILVLTIFFMCATKFSGDEQAVPLDLPQTGRGAAAAGAAPERIDVEASGAVRLAGEAIDLAALGPRLEVLRQERPDLAVTIRGERAVPHGTMAEIYEACRTAGVRQVGIAVRPRAESPR